MQVDQILKLSSTISSPMEYGISPNLSGVIQLPNGKYNLVTTVLPKFQEVEGDAYKPDDKGYLISSTTCQVQSKQYGPILANAIIDLNDPTQVIWIDERFNEYDDVSAWMPTNKQMHEM